jgi:hypothetical protein
MRQAAWSFETSATVNASPESVMAWYFHPDRKDDLRNYFEKTGRDLTLTESINDGMRVRDLKWNHRGWEHHQHIETRLFQTGLPERTGDRFVVPGTDVTRHQSPVGQEITVSCNARVEFIPVPSGGTEIRAIHDHTMTGGMWLQQLSLRRSSRKYTERFDTHWIDQCRAATTLSTGQPD